MRTPWLFSVVKDNNSATIIPPGFLKINTVLYTSGNQDNFKCMQGRSI